MCYTLTYMTDGSNTSRIENPSNPNPGLIVRVDQGEGKAAEVNILSVNGLFSDINKYNDQFSLGAMMFRSISDNLKLGEVQEAADLTKPQQSFLSKEEEYQQMSSSALLAVHGGVLNQVGLSLEPVSGKTITMYGQGEQAGVGEMRLNISDKNKFTSFLGALKPDQVEGRALRPNLESLSGILAKQVLDQYDLKEPSDEALQLFGGLGKIVDQYKRLGMGQAVTGLETYLAHARQGDLKEYVAIEQRGLFSEPGKSFGPADWQKDSTPDHLEERWGDTLRILSIIKENPKAGNLYKQLEVHLNTCAKVAEESISSLKYYDVQTKAEFARILGQVKIQLEEQKPK